MMKIYVILHFQLILHESTVSVLARVQHETILIFYLYESEHQYFSGKVQSNLEIENMDDTRCLIPLHDNDNLLSVVLCFQLLYFSQPSYFVQSSVHGLLQVWIRRSKRVQSLELFVDLLFVSRDLRVLSISITLMYKQELSSFSIYKIRRLSLASVHVISDLFFALAKRHSDSKQYKCSIPTTCVPFFSLLDKIIQPAYSAQMSTLDNQGKLLHSHLKSMPELIFTI